MFSFQFPGSQMPYINSIIRQGAENCIKDEEVILRELREFMASPKRADMIKGIDYYRGAHDILKKKRTVIGEDGKPEAVDNIPNNRIINNQYKKMVDQKVNYLCGKSVTYRCEDKAVLDVVNNVLGDDFTRTLKRLCEDALNCGVGWLYINYGKRGELVLRRIRPWELMPGWEDEEHTRLKYAVRVYDVVEYEGRERKIITKAEIFDNEGIKRMVIDGGRLIPDGIDWSVPYFYRGDEALSWERIPIVAFKYNDSEIPLINNVKTLQDGLNAVLSNFQNGMEEDPRNTILVLKNYDGENLGEFRKNLAAYGAVKVRSADGSQGGVETLSISVNSENYKTIIDIFKKAIIENAMGYDAKDDRLGGNANQLNIKSMYSDIDLDANGMEVEFKAAFNEVFEFVKRYGGVKGDKKIDVVFNRDIIINEGELIENCGKSKGILSDETIIAKHPWVSDVKQELDRIKKESEALVKEYPEPKTAGGEDE